MSESDRLRRLLDELEIRNVLARYARGVDRRDPAMIRACYHDGAVDHHGTFDGDADQFTSWVIEEVSKYSMTMHFLGQILVEPLSDDVAAVETYALGFHRSSGGEQRSNWLAGFRYIDRFERRPPAAGAEPEWRIAERTVVGEWISIDPVENHRGFGGMPTGQPWPTDLVHRLAGE